MGVSSIRTKGRSNQVFGFATIAGEAFMLDSSDPLFMAESAATSLAILDQRLVKRCHIQLPDMPNPMSAIFYQGCFYSYVRFFPSLETAQKAAGRLLTKGNAVVFTQVAKGLVLWVLEAEAQLASKPVVR
ncbi:hypothetical protein H6F90_23855 [Trichocoleus sp. FACHB-591]|uniref:hypothetical protein n=1 Tax=Trichocoleus sp. FACHB-591 TaxID=2692872 RepID=UPI001685AE34|nr:hypothetical protein [Trichocoleus sp. FACHB-591]MBD2098110.1 hypothetical protein [Trichocoleus sp. FACHB-591]